MTQRAVFFGPVPSAAPEKKGVEVLSRQVVGSFDTAVVKEKVAGALNKWLDAEGEAGREMVANGLIYAPLADMEFGNVTNTATQKMRGGLVLARINLQSSTSASNFEIGVGGSPIDAVLRLTATGTKDGQTTRIVSIVEYDANTGVSYEDRLAVNSWRVCAQTGC